MGSVSGEPGSTSPADPTATGRSAGSGLEALTLARFEAEATRFDEQVRLSPDIDGFCSHSAFALAALLGLSPGRTPRLFRVGEAGYLAFAERGTALFGDPRPRRLWEPLEAMWGLCAPVVGADPAALAAALASVLSEEGRGAVLLLCGLHRESERLSAIVEALAGTHRLAQGSSTERRIASLEGGIDGFLSRRSARFRANLRRSLRSAGDKGIVHERHAPTDAAAATRLYTRALLIDDRSWKGRSDTGLRGSGLHDFYAEMLPRLAARGALRMSFLVEHGADVAYLFGGLFGASFRGLQFAFVAGREAESLGNLAQYHAIAALCEEGVGRYDLGTAVDYKRHWGEIEDETVSVIATPRSER